MCLCHPKTIPHAPVHGKIVFHKTGPWYHKNGGPIAKWQVFYSPEKIILSQFGGSWSLNRMMILFPIVQLL